MIQVSRRARRSEEHAGDPLDGLVNLFDLGIVLAVAFLVAGLAAAHVEVSEGGLTRPKDSVTIRPSESTGPVPTDGATVIGQGHEVGKVYQLDDGRLVYVVPSGSASGAAPTGAPTP